MKTNHNQCIGGMSSRGRALAASLSALIAAQAMNAGSIVPPEAGWQRVGSEWTYSTTPLPVSNLDEWSPSDEPLIVAPDYTATIAEGETWDLALEDDEQAAIVLIDDNNLTLDGDLSVTTSHGEVQIASGGVIFAEEGALNGAGNLTVNSAPTGPEESSLITVGVLASDSLYLGDDEDEGFTGAITVTNDNSLSNSSDVVFEGLDLSGSALAVGIAALNPEALVELDLFGAFEDAAIEGNIQSAISATAIARDELVDGEDSYSQTLSAAVAAGVIGVMDDGAIIGDTVIDTVASSGTSIATLTGSDGGESEADSVALSVGFGGMTGAIVDDASISATATSQAATATTSDDEFGAARAHSLAGAAGVIGLVEYGIHGGSESGDGVSITADATSATATATADDYAEGLSAAVSAGIGGVVGMEESGGIYTADITANSAAGAANVDAVDGTAIANSLGVAAGVIGQVGGVITESSITATATSALSEADGEDTAKATSTAVASGVLGMVDGIDGGYPDDAIASSPSGEESVTTINVTATANQAIANARGDAEADASALAYGVGGFEAFGYVLESVLTDVFNGFMDSDLIASDAVESIPSRFGYGLGGDFTVVANASAATATSTGEEEPPAPLLSLPDEVIEGLYMPEGTSAYSYAEAVGYESVNDEPVYGLTSIMDITANAGTATATGVYSVGAYADADAIGVDGDVDGYMDGSITVAANGGSATATGSNDETSLEASADAYAEGIGSFNGYMSEEAVIDVSAVAGDATARFADEVGFAPFGNESSASAVAEAYGIYGSVGEYLDLDSIEGIDLSEGPYSTLDGSITVNSAGGLASANSNGGAYTDASASSYGIARSYDDFYWIESDDSRQIDINAAIDANFDIAAAAGAATSTSSNGMTIATADALGVAMGNVNSINGSLGGTINVLATTVQAMVAPELDAVESDLPEAARSAEARGGANAYASADAAAIGVGFTESARMNGDVSADFTLTAIAGEVGAASEGFFGVYDVVANDLDEEPLGGVQASANAVTVALEEVYAVNGDVSGNFVQTAIAGSATATAESMMIYGAEVENEPGMISSGVVAEATAESLGITGVEGFDGIVNGTVSASMHLTATGGNAIAEDLTDTYAHARASAYTAGVSADVYADEEGGDALTGNFTLSSNGGSASARVEVQNYYGPDAVDSDDYISGASAFADASATSYAVDGDVGGNVSADFDVASTGGFASASDDFGGSRQALAYGDSAGILGGLEGDFTGDMTVAATGGFAVVEEISYDDRPPQPSDAVDAYQINNIIADASAIATGIGDEYDAVSGNVDGSITVTATAGTAIFASFPAETLGDVIDSDVEEFGLDLDASAEAIALDGSVESESVSAVITATAVGGGALVYEIYEETDSVQSTGASYQGDASAFAAGIYGESVVIGELTGGITSTATAGVLGYFAGSMPNLESFDEALDSAFAAGIMTDSEYFVGDDAPEGDVGPMSLLDVVISTYVHAFVEAPEGYELSEENSYAAAVYSGQAGDYVELADGADIIGDINTGGGLNTLTVTGNTIMEGNILSSAIEWIDEKWDLDNGVGTVDFDIESGFFTAVRSVEVSDLANALEIGAEGGLAPVLSQNPEDGESSVLVVNYGNNGNSADVILASGSVVRPVFADGVDMNNVIGNPYVIIDAEGIITNESIVDDSLTPFEYSLQVVSDLPADAIEGIGASVIGGGGDQLVLTAENVQDQDGEQTPGSVQAAQAVSSASQAVMLDVSKHASLLRSLLRRSLSSNATAGSAPTGAAGPNANGLSNGDWLSYVSAFGNIGSQDSGGGYAGFDYDTYGVVMGMERIMGPQLILGLAGSYASTDINGKSHSGGGDSDIYSGAVYANWFTDTWYADGGLTYGQADNDVHRIDYKGAKYHGNYDSDLMGTWGEVGYTTVQGDYGIEPYGRFTYVYGDHDGFTDEGPDAEVMKTDDHDTHNFKTELGARLNREWIYEDNSSFLVEVKAAWQHEWADRGVSVDTSYLGDSNLDIDSADADRDALILGVRAEWACSEGLSLGLEYEPTISGNWYNHAFSGTVQYSW